MIGQTNKQADKQKLQLYIYIDNYSHPSIIKIVKKEYYYIDFIKGLRRKTLLI